MRRAIVSTPNAATTNPAAAQNTIAGSPESINQPLNTGAVVRVPLFITEGEVIRIDTRSGEYVSRASKS